MKEIKIINKMNSKVTVEVHDDCVVVRRDEATADKANYGPYYGGTLDCVGFDAVARAYEVKECAGGKITAGTIQAAPVSREEEAAEYARNVARSVKAIIERSTEAPERETTKEPDKPVRSFPGDLSCNVSIDCSMKKFMAIIEAAKPLMELIQELDPEKDAEITTQSESGRIQRRPLA